RIFAAATHHSQHCLYKLAETLTRPKPREHDAHLQHCLNYLRQNILCAADTTLEPPNWMDRRFEVERTAEVRPRTCEDWTVLRDFVDANHEEWERFKRIVS
ncbi:hypothetical protein BV22DRAFT_1013490, partial [Leucogyrophana mollusca]